MSWTAPTASEFKAFFARDFNFAGESDPNNLDFITNADITRAIDEALINFNEGLYGTEAQVTNVFMYLAAFMLVVNIQNSMKGLASQSKFPISSTNVGSVSVAYSLPEMYAKDPRLSGFLKNGYGLKYLELSMPFLVGNVGVAEGTTT